MDDELPERSMKKFRLDPKSLGEIVAILSRDGRRTVVKLDETKIDDPATLTAAQLHSAKDIDISSYWTNPDHPTWGRRHFVYVMGGSNGVQYFGDSTSEEVITVLKSLDGFFGQAAAPRAVVRSTSATAAPTIFDDGRTLAMLAGVALGLAILFFFIGRWSVGPTFITVPQATPEPMPTTVP
ncbi:MAG: hypothetical protein JWM57_1605 [Phycisphaerales bacterium]|nr:hypothetical protein [Phycisphaerales bacterium]